MPIMIGGIALWSIVHLVPAVVPGFRQALVSRLGEKGYKGFFALAIVASLMLIVIGWRGTPPQVVYAPPSWGRPTAIVMMVVAVYLFGAARRPAVVKRFVRHPQLTGLVTWSVAHLLANGDHRSVALFGGLGIWAVLEIIAINRREGAWTRPAPPALSRELLGIAITLLVFGLLVLAHPWIAGVPLVRFG